MSDEQMSKFSALTKTTTSFPSPPPLETVVPVLKLPPHSPLPSSLGAVVPANKPKSSVTPSPLGAVVPVLKLWPQSPLLPLEQ